MSFSDMPLDAALAAFWREEFEFAFVPRPERKTILAVIREALGGVVHPNQIVPMPEKLVLLQCEELLLKVCGPISDEEVASLRLICAGWGYV